MKVPVLLIFFMILFNSVNCFAQILNIDRVINDSMSKSWYIMLSGTVSFDKQSKDLIDVSNYAEFVKKFRNNYGFISIAQYDATLSQGHFIQDEGFFQIRYRDIDTRVNSFEAFIQNQWNGMWGLVQRNLIGGNYRRRLFVNKNADGYLGLGSFYQVEHWNYSAVENLPNAISSDEKRLNNGVRTNFYLKTAKKLFHNCDFVLENMIQTNLVEINSNPAVRWYAIATVSYDINQIFQLRLNYDQMYNQKPVVPIKNLYYGYKMSLNLLF
jgi:hypothetical protein